MNLVLLLIPVLCLLVCFLIRAEFRDLRHQIYILKPIATLLVISMAVASFWQPVYNIFYTQVVLLGLFLSLGGDLVLMFPQNRKAFSMGLGLFLMAHLAYAVLFFRIGTLSVWTILSLLLLTILGSGFFRLIQSKLGSMRLPVTGYIVIISVMVVSATSVSMNSSLNLTPRIIILTGAVLFYISDLILAANRFWEPWKYSRISLAFYYSGQMLIALAASYLTVSI